MSPTLRKARIVDDLRMMGWLVELVVWRWPAPTSTWAPYRPFDHARHVL